MKKSLILLFVLLAVFMVAGISSAASMPYAIDDIGSFLSDATYFNGFIEITDSFDFSGTWNYTAIAFESGNINYIREAPGGTKTFTTADASNFGVMQSVDFDTDNLYFSDGDPADVPLSEFDPAEPFFRLFRLTAASNPLSYLASKPVLQAGTYILGFNDNGSPPVGDSDFDDIIVAANPVPEPGTLILLGAGLAGLFGWGRKKFRTNL
jgi:hypothetical protein